MSLSERGADIAVQAYILIQTEVDKASTVARTTAELEWVTHAEEVLGPYEVIVRVEVAESRLIKELVLPRIRAVDGITRTLTCEVVAP